MGVLRWRGVARALACVLLVASVSLLPLPAATAMDQAKIAFRASSTGRALEASSLTVDAPTGTRAGDVLVAHVARRGDLGQIAATGWSQVGSAAQGDAFGSAVLVTVVGPGGPQPATFVAEGTGDLVASVSAFSGVDALEPVDVYRSQDAPPGRTLPTPDFTTTAGNDVVAWFGSQSWTGSACQDRAISQPFGSTRAAQECVGDRDHGLALNAAYRQVGSPSTRSGWTGTARHTGPGTVQVVALRPAGPVVVHRGTTTAALTGTRTLDLPVPAGTAAGDVLVAHLANRNHVDEVPQAPDGWRLVRKDSSRLLISSWVYLYVATVDDPPSWTWSVHGRQTLAGSLSVYQGVDTARPVDVDTGRVNGSSASLSAMPLSTTTNHDQLVWLGTQAQNTGSCPSPVLTAPAGLEERGSGCAAGLGRGLRTSVADGALALAGPVAEPDGRSADEATNAAQVVALRPAVPVSASDRYANVSIDVGRLWLDAGNKRNTDIPLDVLTQPSGLAMSRLNPDVAFVHSEKDVHGLVAVSTKDAEIRGTYSVPIPDQWDWEDIATGPCPTGSCLFAGDIGRSNGKPDPPSTFAVYRVPEPDLADGHTSGTLTGDWFRFRYPDGPRNAEALMVDPVTGQIYVIDKVQDGQSGVYTFPGPLPAPSAETVTTLTRVATLHVPTWTGDPGNVHASTWYAQVTAAAVHPAGDRFVIRTPYKVWEYRAAPGEPLSSAFSASPVALTSPSGEGQGEAIDYAPDGSAYYTVSEAPAPPYTLKRVNRI